MLRSKPNSFEDAERAALEFFSCRRLTRNHFQLSSGIESEVDVLYGRKAFLLLIDEGLFQIRVQDPNPHVPRGSHATTSSVADHLALVGKSISSYLVVDRRVQGTILAVLRLGVATLRWRSRLVLRFRDVPGLLSVTSVLVLNLQDVAMALFEPILGRNLVPPTIRAIALRPWKLMC